MILDFSFHIFPFIYKYKPNAIMCIKTNRQAQTQIIGRIADRNSYNCTYGIKNIHKCTCNGKPPLLCSRYSLYLFKTCPSALFWCLFRFKFSLNLLNQIFYHLKGSVVYFMLLFLNAFSVVCDELTCFCFGFSTHAVDSSYEIQGFKRVYL